MLGFGKKHPKVDDFIGNYIALSTASSMIRIETFLADGKPVKKSTHCGLTKEEMEVPVIIIKNNENKQNNSYWKLKFEGGKDWNNKNLK